MEIHEIRNLLKTRSIFDIPLRVTYYARVSSESDEQLNSLGNQITYYEDMIRRNQNWTFVPGYIDEGISGISTKKRENFNRMIEDAAKDMFDLVITKEISRFARNTLDSIQYTRQLLGNGVGVFFQNDNINTFDEDSELRLAIMSSIAQDELRKLSSRVRFGHQQAIKGGVVLGNSRIFGYVKDDGRLVIDEKEAEMVRELFLLYASNHYSLKQIEQILWDKGYRNRNGKRINHNTMSSIIGNPKYKGYYVGNRYRVVDMFTKRIKSLPPEEWVMYKDESGEIVPPIVSEELWEAANTVLRRRSEDVRNRQGICNHANLLTGKLFCTCCSVPYYRKESVDKNGKKNSRWVCSNKIKNGAHTCESFAIYEDELKPVLLELVRDTKVATEAMIAAYTEMFRSVFPQDELDKRREAVLQRREKIEMKASKLLEYNVDGKITDADFIRMNQQCSEELALLDTQLEEIDNQNEHQKEFNKQIEAVRKALRTVEQAAATGAITKDFLDEYIERINITPEKGDILRLEVELFTGESTRLYFQKLKGRAGQMSKKMIEAYEQGMQ